MSNYTISTENNEAGINKFPARETLAHEDALLVDALNYVAERGVPTTTHSSRGARDFR